MKISAPQPLRRISPSMLALAMTATLIVCAANPARAAGTHAGHDHGEAMTSIGKPGLAGKVKRTITIDAQDTMRFTPSDIRVKKGETVRFVIRNAGKQRHEFGLGTETSLAAHYEQMKKSPGMVHNEANQITIEPGATGEVVWQFTTPGTVSFACLLPGHFDAGMKGAVTVAN